MSKATWVAEPKTKRDKVKALILELVNDIEKEYGERNLTLTSAKIENLVDNIIKELAA